MNKTIEDIISRRSVKKYLDKPVPMELVEEVVKAGTYAPSGMNKQSPIIIAVTNKAMRDRLSKLMEKAERGENIDDRFFDSYDELLLQSPYLPAA